MLRGHFGHSGSSWQICLQECPQIRDLSQTCPQLGIGSVQDNLTMSKGFFPHGQVLTTSGLRSQTSQFSLKSWQILLHLHPQLNDFPQGFSHEKNESTPASQSTHFSWGFWQSHFCWICTPQGSQFPVWHWRWHRCLPQFKSLSQVFSHIGVVPHLPCCLVLPHGQVL